jgi:hypothetical protein
LLYAECVQKTTAANLGISLLFIKTCVFFHNPTKIISSVQFSALSPRSTSSCLLVVWLGSTVAFRAALQRSL